MPRKAKPRTPAQQERDTDLRLQRTYGITLAEYNERLARQGGGCAICGKPPGTKRLHTDHCHKFAKQFKIIRTKLPDGQYMANAEHRTDKFGRFYIEFIESTKALAVAAVKRGLKRGSVRGILCWPCNRSLRSFNDDPQVMEQAARYLRHYTGRTA